ncbi:bifunctional methylenetetrahydrofolate dehydrogenase/methenyltetrahydrofolate cyclohydrolase [Thermoanaerobacterium thermosaccharolyticum]|jgi:methylenetetrahydrofolate dehydrogenase (NADP+)/methenyltetrahydrofolate cyclohydrolase|uniref:Bifunctional protein FolD n=1 Tax=Thermoanaerobacterium thermosaccharolyticum TaxID=1517 RepID=A0A223I398_THETR|nr:bifunctional 5,10-methylenetetrahydrofolate dehydrogenase/5,10-methenyltetrahydrofolate cyclohydrolase [Thermoanaerobacterium thermosaccharolyticum]AST59137.1 bifunctional protein FolD [Thermoanaerobacterium thermosaccharolyticum]KAA5807634.1 bifunctional 5,10-methylenetetrahydrofolate dehydrogenase/5,10-methenyltetrahydrofolate cyclohydrolase [Thermoanaerobacterium thermosaccharolyticum]MBE0067711.1 bifunctional 5,10-methylenetetrahydrofolate dehydrogenase/5,10-methenyltetrahydrofolate cyclo
MIIDGKVIAKRIRANIKAEIQENNYKPKLAILIAGNDSASKIYANAKVKACAGVGIDAEVFCFSDSEEGKFLNKLEELNVDENIHGIFVEMPLPKSFNSQRTYDIINPLKDVDCISTYNMGRLFAGNPLYLPCTPHAILTILKQLDINFTGKHAVIVGRSNILGKPVAKLMLDLDMTVTQCHSKTVDLQKYTKMADVLILAAGKKNLINGDMIKEGVILIDAGINEYDGKIYGDCDFQSAENRCLYITPVPGGVGPVTTSMVLLNTLEAYKNAIKNTYSKTSQ